MRISCGLWVMLAAVGLFGCSGTGSSGSPSGGGGGNGAAAGTSGMGGAGASGGSAGSGGGPIDAGSSDAPPAGKAAVFGHGPATLYKLDPNTLQVQTIGPFSGCTDVWDIALDKDSNMYATTETGLWRINPDTAVCQLIASGGPFPNSLSFVPAGTLDPNTEALVGYEQTDYVRIDPTTGAIQTVKAAALTGGMVSSGDIVSVIGGKTFLTVKQGPCADSDCLIEIDPKTGSAIGNLGNVNQKGVFGLGFWAGRAYGFTNTGVLFEITLSSSGLTTSAINVPGAPGDLKFWGAGSTTAAPPDPT